MEIDTIYINIPCPTKKEAIKLCGQMLEKDLCGTAKIHENTHLMWKDGEGLHGEDICLMTLKTTKKNLADINEFILKKHSWGTPCIEVVPVVNDMC